MILHVCVYNDWLLAEKERFYKTDTFDKIGFIHCCTSRQLDGVLTRYFQGIKDLCVLTIDEERLTSPLKYEVGTGREEFPHVYGPVNVDAVVSVERIE
jgi:uncharacterized protein (DUF952 family)